MSYICHWKDKLINHGVITTVSLSFQEDESFINCVLSYPDPISDHSKWSTVYLYGLKFLTSISSAGLNLYRGITQYPRLSDSASLMDVIDFSSTINHVSASVSSYQRILPELHYDNESFHGGEILYHIKALQKSEKVFGFIIPIKMHSDFQ